MASNKNIPSEYAKFFKIKRVVRRKAVRLNINDPIVIGFTEIGILTDEDLVEKHLTLILPEVSISIKYDKVSYEIRPTSVPKVVFYKITPTKDFLKIRGVDTYYSIPISNDCKIEDKVIIPYLDNYIIIKLDQLSTNKPTKALAYHTKS